MKLSLGDLFTPSFDSEDAIIKHEHFSNTGNPEILSFQCDNIDQFYKDFFGLFLAQIQQEYYEKYNSNRLDENDIEDIINTISGTEFTNPQGQTGIIAELVLRDMRSNTHGSSDNHTNNHILKGISSTTHPGADLIEIIKEDDNYLMLSWDARHNQQNGNGLTNAITDKLVDLYSKRDKRKATRRHIDQIEGLTDSDRNIFKQNILTLNHKQIIFLFSVDGDITLSSNRLLEKKNQNENSITGNGKENYKRKCRKENLIIQKMIDTGNYDKYWVKCTLSDYDFKEITHLIFNPTALRTKLLEHAAI